MSSFDTAFCGFTFGVQQDELIRLLSWVWLVPSQVLDVLERHRDSDKVWSLSIAVSIKSLILSSSAGWVYDTGGHGKSA